MSANLFDMFKDAVGGTLVNKASAMLGESEATTSSALGAILPALMGSMVNKGASESGATGILDFLKGGNFDGGLLNNVGDVLSGGDETKGLLASGAGILKFLVGDKLGSLVDLVSGSSGMKTGSTNTMMKMVGPLLMSVVGKFVKDKALDALGLKNLFASQASEIQKRLPSGFGDLLGLGGLGNLGSMASSALGSATASVGNTKSRVSEAAGSMAAATTATASATASKAADTAKSAGGGLSKILPWLALALGALGILWWISKGDGTDTLGDMKDKTEATMKDAGNAVKDGAVAVGDAIEDGANAAGDAVKDGAEAVGDAMRSFKLPGGKEIEAKPGSFTARLANKMSNANADLSKSIVFDNVNFETGSAKITADSEEQLQNLADILTAYKTSNIKVIGHTDNTGNADSNMKLSQQRAMSVKNWLAQHGIASARVVGEGKGQTMPAASNATEEGKAKNRRIEVYVTKK